MNEVGLIRILFEAVAYNIERNSDGITGICMEAFEVGYTANSIICITVIIN